MGLITFLVKLPFLIVYWLLELVMLPFELLWGFLKVLTGGHGKDKQQAYRMGKEHERRRK